MIQVKSLWTIYLKQKKNKKIKETGNSQYIYQNKLDKACFQHNRSDGEFNDWPSRTAADKVLCDNALNIAKNAKYDGYQCRFIYVFCHWFIYVLIKNILLCVQINLLVAILKIKIIPNQQLAEELHKPTFRKSEKQKVYLSFKGNMWGADLANMKLISKFNTGFHFLLCVIDVYSKHVWVVPLKDKKSIANTNAFQKMLDESTIENVHR